MLIIRTAVLVGILGLGIQASHTLTPPSEAAGEASVVAAAPVAVAHKVVRKVKPTPSRSRAYARSLVSAKQFQCLDKLWTRESNWRHTADNPNSSAYGIPQALPGKKMASAGKDWRTNPETQINWGLKYINSVYGSPCNAWAFWKKHHWY